jgi:hypothetical protein
MAVNTIGTVRLSRCKAATAIELKAKTASGCIAKSSSAKRRVRSGATHTAWTQDGRRPATESALNGLRTDAEGALASFREQVAQEQIETLRSVAGHAHTLHRSYFRLELFDCGHTAHPFAARTLNVFTGRWRPFKASSPAGSNSKCDSTAL